MKKCKDCEAYNFCKSKSAYERHGEVCFWFVDGHIKAMSDKEFIADIRKIVFDNAFPEYIVDKLQGMFKTRESERNE